MTVFYICRHGQTENNKNCRLSGWIDTPLTSEGVQDALSSATKLQGIQFDKIVSSDLGRAFTTAYLISRQIGYTSEIQRTSGLREVNYGELANQPYESHPELDPSAAADYVFPGGESFGQMQQRVVSCVEDLAGQYEGKMVLLTVHDGTINAIRSHFSGQDIGIANQVNNPHDFVAKFVVEDGKITSFDELK